MVTRLNDSSRDQQLYGVELNWAYGTFKLYTGTQPGSAGGSHSDTLLATFTFNGFGAKSSGVMPVTTGAMTLPVTAAATGTVGWGRIESAGKIADLTITVTSGGGDIEMPDLSVTSGDSITLSNMNFNQPGA